MHNEVQNSNCADWKVAKLNNYRVLLHFRLACLLFFLGHGAMLAVSSVSRQSWISTYLWVHVPRKYWFFGNAAWSDRDFAEPWLSEPHRKPNRADTLWALACKHKCIESEFKTFYTPTFAFHTQTFAASYVLMKRPKPIRHVPRGAMGGGTGNIFDCLYFICFQGCE